MMLMRYQSQFVLIPGMLTKTSCPWSLIDVLDADNDNDNDNIIINYSNNDDYYYYNPDDVIIINDESISVAGCY